MRKLISSLLAALPTITVGLDDWHLHVSVGESQVGFTVGPHFLSLDYKGDIARMLVSPPEGYEAPLSDITFSWDSRGGLSYLSIPEVRRGAHMNPEPVSPLAIVKGWDDVGEEEPEPSTLRFIRTPTYIDEQRAIAGEDVYGGF